MSLTFLRADNFRIIRSAEIEPSPHLNLITGSNGAGKSSLLEAIYMLSTARSFRSMHFQEVLTQGQTSSRVTAKVQMPMGNSINLGLERSKSNLTMRAEGRKLTRVSELAAYLPTQIIYPDSHLLVSGGPKQRRRFLDWGLFHVEHSFLPVWQRYEKALKQRNASLRQPGFYGAEQSWDNELTLAAEEIHLKRKQYLEKLEAILPSFGRSIIGTSELEIEYHPGWDTQESLKACLTANLNKDRQRGFTSRGPHRANLVFKINACRAEQHVSRGQQKMLVCSLMLAQAQLLNEQVGRTSTILLDDFTAELDSRHKEKLIEMLYQMQTQVFITATDKEAVHSKSENNMKMFHVEQGRIEEMLY